MSWMNSFCTLRQWSRWARVSQGSTDTERFRQECSVHIRQWDKYVLMVLMLVQSWDWLAESLFLCRMRYVTYDSDDPIIVTPLPEIGESIRTIPFAINVWNLFWCPPSALMMPIVRRWGAQIRVLVLICWFWSSGLLSSNVDSGIVSTQTILLDNWCLYLFYLTRSTVKKYKVSMRVNWLVVAAWCLLLSGVGSS